jgi:hypothetical protein
MKGSGDRPQEDGGVGGRLPAMLVEAMVVPDNVFSSNASVVTMVLLPWIRFAGFVWSWHC